MYFFRPSAEPKRLVCPVSCRRAGVLEPLFQADFYGLSVGLLVFGGAATFDNRGHRPQLPAETLDRTYHRSDAHAENSNTGIGHLSI